MSEYSLPLSLSENICRLLSPQPCLAPWIFNQDGVMRGDIRSKILMRTKVLIENTIISFPGIKVDDILLIGSSASYIYHAGSDFDIKIKLSFARNRFFIKNKKAAKSFLVRQIFAYLAQNRTYRIDGRLVDFKLTFSLPTKVHGMYSVLQNRWLVVPNQDLTAGISLQPLYDSVIKRSFEISDKMFRKLQRYDGKYRLQDLQKLMRFHQRTVGRQYENVFEYLVFKLLHYEGHSKDIMHFCTEEMRNTLSINLPPECLKK